MGKCMSRFRHSFDMNLPPLHFILALYNISPALQLNKHCNLNYFLFKAHMTPFSILRFFFISTERTSLRVPTQFLLNFPRTFRTHVPTAPPIHGVAPPIAEGCDDDDTSAQEADASREQQHP